MTARQLRRISVMPSTTGKAGALDGVADVAGLDWQDRALCAEVDPEIFFPPLGNTGVAAKRICRACPVQDECLEYALDTDQRFGIWGGYGEKTRERIRRARHKEDAA